MIVQTPASTTASNGARYTSRSVRSSMRERYSVRSVSVSLPMKCFTQAAMPCSWIASTKATASRAVRSGSSERHSKCRPPTGLRCRLTTGARITSTALRRASAAMSVPRRACRSTSHVAAVADGAGSCADGSPSSPVPRTPMGPSDTVMVRRPSSGIARRVQVAAPVSSATFSSRGSDLATAMASKADEGAIVSVPAVDPSGSRAPVAVVVELTPILHSQLVVE